ncbi:MAG: hypothetical protein ACFWUL_05460 [Dialister sp.]|jgi:hypothetical protein
MKDLMRCSEGFLNVSFHPWYRRERGGPEELGNFPFRSLSLPKESVRTENDGKKKREKIRTEKQNGSAVAGLSSLDDSSEQH